MINFNKKIQEQFAKMCSRGKLFRVSISGQSLWDLYLASFKQEDDPIFRDPNSTSHTCNHCNNFVRRYGNIVSVADDNSVECMFDVEVEPQYKESALAMATATKTSKIVEVFFETFNELNDLPYESCAKNNAVFRLGINKNVKRYTKEEAEKYGVVKPNEIREFHHMHLDLPSEYVDMSGSSVENVMGDFRSSKEVFQRGMEEIALDTLQLVRDLIIQGSLLNGQTHLYKVEQFIPLKEEYNKLSEDQKDNWCWVKSYKFPLAKFKNELIGVLCSELSEGEELNKACESWNKRVDPINYMKVTAPITKKQIEEAQKFVEENGYAESFNRRFATIDDIKVTEIKHINVGKGDVKKISVFDGVKATSTRHKRSEFEGIEEVTIDKFMKEILPTCTSVEAFLANSHQGNMVSITTANDPDSKPIFKWPNNYSWTFSGNLAGKSQIKEAVKSEGGKVDGALRFSIMWNEDGKDILDFDAHAKEPSGTEIYFGSYKKPSKTVMSGQLDVDMIRPHKMGIENITWSDKAKMKEGVYRLWIRNYDGGTNKGFKAEIEFEGEAYTYEYGAVSGRNDVQIAEVTLKNGSFTIKHLIPESTVSSKEIYGLETNEFHKVNLVCLSPNHWDDNNVGNKHYFFMLDGCKSPNPVRSFHNENLIPDLVHHRKVMEVLGATHTLPPVSKQLSGLGFNSTVKDELVVKLGDPLKEW